MLRDSAQARLLLPTRWRRIYLGGSPAYVKPFANAMMHNSMRGIWPLGEFWPKFTKKRVSPPGVTPAKWVGRPRINLAAVYSDSSCIHESVFLRKAMVPGYAPKLPDNFSTEPGDCDLSSPSHCESNRRCRRSRETQVGRYRFTNDHWEEIQVRSSRSLV